MPVVANDCGISMVVEGEECMPFPLTVTVVDVRVVVDVKSLRLDGECVCIVPLVTAAVVSSIFSIAVCKKGIIVVLF